MNLETRLDKISRILATTTLVFFLSYGVVITFFPVIPFWVDEWFIIENLKFRTAPELWHVLNRTQQFPRVYLQIVKSLTSACDYSYTSLRLCSFITHSLGILLLYRLSARIFKKETAWRLLWVVIYVAYNTSIHYFAQVKQYTMEMALSLVGLWQLLELLNVSSERPNRWRYLLLNASFIACPFFSYTYPIVMAPIYIVVVSRSIKAKKWNAAAVLPLSLGIISVAVFYYVDVRHVLADKGMQDFWQDLIMKTFSFPKLCRNVYAMFCNIGAGELFGNLFGIIGVSAFLFSTWQCVKKIFSSSNATDYPVVYSCLLIWVVIVLYMAGKLPLGTFRLNAFTVPALGILVIHLLKQTSELRKMRNPGLIATFLLFLASIGNVFATALDNIAGKEHERALKIYQTTIPAIQQARKEHIPILVTPTIAFPFDDRWQGDWILRTHPAYKWYDEVPIYAIPNANSADSFIQKMPAKPKAVIMLDGDNFRRIDISSKY